MKETIDSLMHKDPHPKETAHAYTVSDPFEHQISMSNAENSTGASKLFPLRAHYVHMVH